MSAQSVEKPRAVVERSRINFQQGDQVVCQMKNRPTDVPYIQNYPGRVEVSVRNIGGEVTEFLVRPLHTKEVINFHVVDELPDDWKHRILRKRG